jgi:transcriptional regulator with XRE-family HTH domain
LEVTETLCNAMEANNINKTQVATKLGKSKGFVSQLLAGGRNLTLRSIADVADAIGCRAHFVVEPQQVTTAINDAGFLHAGVNQTANIILWWDPTSTVTLPAEITVEDGKERLAA